VRLRFKDIDGRNSDTINAAALLEAEFLESLDCIFPITIRSARGILATPLETTVHCLKSIATHDESLLETNLAEIAV